MSLTNTVLSAVVGLGILSTGCATKKFVKAHVAPIDERVGVVEKKTTEQAGSIESLETGLSRTKEQVTDVDGRAKAAAAAADKANTQALQASSAADAAKTAADGAKQYAEQGLMRLERTVAESNNYQLVANDSVLFPTGRYELTKDGKAALDTLVKNVEGKKHFVIEVEGFTDKTGPAAFNFELSKKRAESVARYLTLDHQIPLRSIHMLGAGSGAPVADNNTRNGRMQNRRVEVRLFVSATEAAKPLASAQ